jgi:hydrogenase nickel incorporation protein HypA/HybF
MHELSIAGAIVEACAEQAAGLRILRVRVEVGELAAVLPDSLRFCFDVCARGTPAEGAALEIVETPGRAECEACQATLAMSIPLGRCGCGGKLRIVAGRELRLIDMEIS